MNNSGLKAIGSTATGPQYSRWTPSRVLPSALMLGLFLSFGAGQARAQCGSLGAPSTNWQNGGNSFWNIDGNWTSGTPTASTNACVLNGVSTVTLNTTGNANGLELATGNNLAITGAGSLTLVGASVNFGLIMNSGSFTNHGTINANPPDQFGGSITNAGLLTNTGTINVSELTNDGTMNNSGRVGDFIVGTQTNFTNNGTLNNTGVVFVNENHIFINFGTVNNNNTIDTLAFGRITNVGTFNNNGTIGIGDTSSLLSNLGTMNNNGTINTAGGFSNTGALNNNGTVESLFVFGNSGTVNNHGTLTVATAQLGNSGTVNNFGTLNSAFNLVNTGTLNVMGTLNATGLFGTTNSGTLNVLSSGSVTAGTSYTQTAGSTLVNGTFTATGGAIVDIEGGVLGGTGAINGDVLLKGILSPGSNGIPGVLTINGNYEQGGTGVFDELISGANSNGVLDVTGILALDPGSLLEITLQGGFDPLGDSFTILNFGSLLGEFSNAPIFFADGFEWTVTYGANDAVLTAIGVPEPGSMPLFAIGLLALFWCAGKRGQRSEL
jgi:hypothetical protein